MHFPSAPINKDKERFSFKDCKVWNIYNAECLDVYVLGNIDPGYTGCSVLNIPNDPHPWNAMRSIIDQFYQREKEIALERHHARKAIEKTAKLEERNKQLDEGRWILDSRVGELKKEIERLTDLQTNVAINAPTPKDGVNTITPIDELLELADPGEWVDNIDSIIDCLISLMRNDKDVIDGSDLYFARRLQQFFMRLDKATGTIADNRNIRPEAIDLVSKNI